jgi:hypothetical protein
MDLVHGAKRVVVIMEHVNKHGESKVKKECTLPLTGQRVVYRLITDLAMFDFSSEGMTLVETQEGVTVSEVIEKTEICWFFCSNFDPLQICRGLKQNKQIRIKRGHSLLFIKSASSFPFDIRKDAFLFENSIFS